MVIIGVILRLDQFAEEVAIGCLDFILQLKLFMGVFMYAVGALNYSIWSNSIWQQQFSYSADISRQILQRSSTGLMVLKFIKNLKKYWRTSYNINIL